MRRELGIRQAQRAAVALLSRCGATTAAHIELARIAAKLEVDIVEGGIEGARARLQYGDRPVIRVSERLVHAGMRRFSIAHEFGHLELQHPPGDCEDRSPARRAKAGGRDLEAEADAFAAELLMPTAQVRPRCEVSPLDLDIARGIAAEFEVSIVAAALRLVELTSERAAVVYAERGAIGWALSSPPLTWHLPRGQRLDRQTVAADYFRSGRLDERPQPIAIGAWFGHDRAGDADLIEHSIALAAPPAVLSLLWVPEMAAAGLHWDDSQSADGDRTHDLSDGIARLCRGRG